MTIDDAIRLAANVELANEVLRLRTVESEYGAVLGSNSQMAAELTRLSNSTTCASCGELKVTPLRRDEMGGYVCLTCIERVLDKPRFDVSAVDTLVSVSAALAANHGYQNLGALAAAVARSRRSRVQTKRTKRTARKTEAR